MKSLAFRGLRKLKTILEMIKFEHTVFALPFALISMVLAADGLPEGRVIFWILVAMVGARSSAMAFNRIADITYDRLNPRTADRALPRGVLTLSEVWLFTLFSAAAFVFAAYMLNPLAFALSPVALIVILGYSYTKRFTSLTHLVLGLALGIAPVGAWIAVRGQFNLAPIVLSAAVMFWTAGFDIIYALQDIEFDRAQGLFSIPRFLGIRRSLMVSRLFHFAAITLLVVFGAVMSLGEAYYVGTAAAAALLIYEQSLVKPHDISKVNIAFFNTNGLVSIGLLIFTVLDLLIRKGML
ncbi:MAG: UbiA-like polyprenyltransferase [Armatimonadota bacterium]|nr:UbiA-like polyprenyltransferase [Armatimonadota bacterium]